MCHLVRRSPESLPLVHSLQSQASLPVGELGEQRRAAAIRFVEELSEIPSERKVPDKEVKMSLVVLAAISY